MNNDGWFIASKKNHYLCNYQDAACVKLNEN